MCGGGGGGVRAARALVHAVIQLIRFYFFVLFIRVCVYSLASRIRKKKEFWEVFDILACQFLPDLTSVFFVPSFVSPLFLSCPPPVFYDSTSQSNPWCSLYLIFLPLSFYFFLALHSFWHPSQQPFQSPFACIALVHQSAPSPRGGFLPKNWPKWGPCVPFLPFLPSIRRLILIKPVSPFLQNSSSPTALALRRRCHTSDTSVSAAQRGPQSWSQWLLRCRKERESHGVDVQGFSQSLLRANASRVTQRPPTVDSVYGRTENEEFYLNNQRKTVWKTGSYCQT